MAQTIRMTFGRMRRRDLAVACLVLASPFSPVLAQEREEPAAAPSVNEQLEQMRGELDRLRDENARMQGEIDALKAEDDDWLTEARAEELRALVSDVLADADQRVNSQNGMQAGWSEHFFLASPDGRFELQFEGQLQLRWLYNYLDSDRTTGNGPPDRHISGFENTRTRLALRGHVFNDDLTFLVRADVSREDPAVSTDGLLYARDIWIAYDFGNDWSVRFGTFKLPYNREELVSPAYQMAVERTLLNESLNLGRSQGIQITKAGKDAKFTFMVSDGAQDQIGGRNDVATGSVVTTNPFTPGLDRDVEWAFTARQEWLLAGNWQQFADFTSPPGDEYGVLFGLAGHAQTIESGEVGPRSEFEWYSATADLSIEWGGASFFAAFMYTYVDGPFNPLDILGGVVQASMYFTPKFEGFARFEYGIWEATFDVPDDGVVTLGGNYYLDGHDVKWSTDISFGLTEIGNLWDSPLAGFRVGARGSEPQIVFRTQLQLLF